MVGAKAQEDEMKNIIPEGKPIITIVFFAFCVALFFCVLQNIVFGKVGRYLPLSQERMSYIDTATGAVYRATGGFIGRPDRWETFLALWGLDEKSKAKRAMLNDTDPVAKTLLEIRSPKILSGSQGGADNSRIKIELPDKNIAISFPVASSEEEMRRFLVDHFYSKDIK